MKAEMLDGILNGCLAETPDVEVRDGHEYLRRGVLFADRLSGGGVDLRLGADIAEAALRTSGTSPSSRGEDWITLQPDDWSTANDRLEAWYRVAWRLAGKAKR